MKPASSAAPPNADSSLTLSQAEEEVTDRENRLLNESQQLSQNSRQVASRLETLRRNLLSAATEGASRDPEMHRLSAEVERTFLPVLDLNPQRTASQQARMAAIQARRGAVEQAERALGAYTASLQALAYQVEAQQQALTAALTRLQAAPMAKAAPPEEAKVMELKRRQPPAGASVDSGAGAASGAGPTSVPSETSNMSRRYQPRVKLQAAVSLSSDSNFFTGFSTNLSEGGLFIATVNCPPRGTVVDVKFSLPNGVQLEAKGVVRWTREVNDETPDIFPGVGVQFTELEPPALMAIKKFVGKREPMFFPDS